MLSSRSSEYLLTHISLTLPGSSSLASRAASAASTILLSLVNILVSPQPIEMMLISDFNKNIARDYGVLIEEAGIALRGLFIVDPQGVLR